MSDQVNVGEYSLEISGDEVLVRDESGAVVESVELDEVVGELTLPDGRKVDLAAVFADSGVEAFQTAAGPANDNLGFINGGQGTFKAFRGHQDPFGGLKSAGTLTGTTLDLGGTGAGERRGLEPTEAESETPILVTWSSHEPWQIAENQSGGSFGKVVSGNPADFTFEVSDARFEIVDGILRVRDGVGFDYEAAPAVELEITATSRTGDTKTLSVEIAVTDVNEAQTELAIDNATIQENALGAAVGTLTVADPDKDDAQSFQVSDDRFEVTDGKLTLKEGVALDHESEPTVELTVTATDGAGNQIERAFTINVSDVNEAPTDIDLSGNVLVENVAGAVVGALSVVDPDAGDAHAFEVSDDRFEIADGQLKLRDGIALDFETEPSLDVVVTVTDGAGNKMRETFTLSVADVNEGQSSLSLGKSSVAENAKGAVIGTVLAADPDAGDSQTYTVSDSRFQIVNGQLALKTGVSLDHEAEREVNVTVTATDQAGHTIAQTFTIDVLDVNEKQTAMTLSASRVTENDKGAVIGTLSVTDPDVGDLQTFKVSDSRFEVVDGQLKLKDGVSLNYEAASKVNVKVTATDSGGNQITKTFTINVQNVNEAQTAMSLSGSKVAENAAGAVIGTLKVSDPDRGDSQSFQVSDSRFEVVNGQLKLKDGVSLDYEQASKVTVGVTATDSAGHQIAKTFTITVGNVNEAQTAMTLSANSVKENVAGAAIGALSVADPDAGDRQSFTVSDPRFEVVNNQLRLKPGVALDHEQAASVSVDVTATDKGGNQITKTFTVDVANVNEAPTVTAADGTFHTHVVDTSTAYNPLASGVVGDYLHSNDSAGIKAPAAGLLNGVDPSNMTLSAETAVTVTFQKEAAGNRNMVGTYQYDDNGNIVPGSVRFVWLDATANVEGTLGANLVKDFLGNSQPATVALGTMPAGTHVGFFVISNGAGNSGNRTALTNAAAGAGNYADAAAAIAGQLSIQVDANGNGRVFVGGTQLNGDVFFTHDKSLNTDFNGSSDIHHVASGVSAGLPGQLLIGVEDLNGGGDKDYNDVVFSVDLGTYNVNKLTRSAVQPAVDFSDADSSTLSQVVIQTSGFQAGDTLNVPPSGLFNVAVAQSGADYTITIVGKTGAETLDQYEDLANSIYFSTSNQAGGARHIAYTVTDDGGLSSTVATAEIAVSSSYEVSSSQLGSGQTILGTGDDLLHVNTGSLGPTNMGDGYDTAHLAVQGMSFGRAEAAKLANVEAIDATGYGANQVSLSIDDVLGMTDDDHRLTIVGEQGDSVILTGSGGNHWTIVESNAAFTTYAYSDPSMQAIVEISNQLNTQVS